jgi:hypothetical protein
MIECSKIGGLTEFLFGGFATHRLFFKRRS